MAQNTEGFEMYTFSHWNISISILLKRNRTKLHSCIIEIQRTVRFFKLDIRMWKYKHKNKRCPKKEKTGLIKIFTKFFLNRNRKLNYLLYSTTKYYFHTKIVSIPFFKSS